MLEALGDGYRECDGRKAHDVLAAVALPDFLARSQECAMCALMDRAEYQHLLRFGTAVLEDEVERRRLYDRRARVIDISGSFVAASGVRHWPKPCSMCSRWYRKPLPRIFLPEDSPLEPSRCWLCSNVRRNEATCVRAFVTLLGDDRFREIYERSAGLCIPHLRTAIARTANSAMREWLAAVESRQWHSLQIDLEGYAQVRSAPGKRTTSEQASPDRCIAKLVGTRGRQWRPDT